jgi:hypothetical protein
MQVAIVYFIYDMECGLYAGGVLRAEARHYGSRRVDWKQR